MIARNQKSHQIDILEHTSRSQQFFSVEACARIAINQCLN